MVFKYDTREFIKYKRNKIFHVITYCWYVFFIYLLYFSAFMANNESYQFVKMFTIIYSSAIGIGCVFGILLVNIIAKKSLKKSFESFKIECDDNEIIITNNNKKKIKVSQIKKILKDKYNNYYVIKNKLHKIKIDNYLDDKDGFEKYLSNISVIERYSIIDDIIEYIPIILFIVFLCTFKINIQLYFISAVIVLLITIFVVIKIFISKYKFIPNIFCMFLYCIILIFMIISLYNNIKNILYFA